LGWFELTIVLVLSHTPEIVSSSSMATSKMFLDFSSDTLLCSWHFMFKIQLLIVVVDSYDGFKSQLWLFSTETACVGHVQALQLSPTL